MFFATQKQSKTRVDVYDGMSFPSHGTVRFVGEVLAAPAEFRSIRTFGRLASFPLSHACPFSHEPFALDKNAC